MTVETYSGWRERGEAKMHISPIEEVTVLNAGLKVGARGGGLSLGPDFNPIIVSLIKEASGHRPGRHHGNQNTSHN